MLGLAGAGLLPLFALAALRGNVGSDTFAYLQIIESIKNRGESHVGVGFVWLVKAMLYFGTEPQLIIIFITVITSGLLVFAAMQSKRAMMVSIL